MIDPLPLVTWVFMAVFAAIVVVGLLLCRGKRAGTGGPTVPRQELVMRSGSELRDYERRMLEEMLRSLGSKPPPARGATTLYAMAEQAVKEGIRFVENTPASDPFWRRPCGDLTLGAFCDRILERDPSDTRGLWIRIADNLKSCFRFDGDVWKRLHALGKLEVQWPVYATWDFFSSTSRDTGKCMVELIRELDLADGARVVLSAMPGDAAGWAGRWIKRL